MYLLLMALLSLYVKFFTSLDPDIAYTIIMGAVVAELLFDGFKKPKKKEQSPKTLSDYLSKEYGVLGSSNEDAMQIIDSKGVVDKSKK